MWDTTADSAPWWFAVQVRGGKEQFAREHLSARGYEIFLPVYRDRRCWSDRTKSIDRALFTGYLFCRLTTDTVANIVTTPGVIRVVGDGGRPLAVETAEIVALQQIAAAALAAEPWTFVRAGQPVEIVAGPLRGLEGVVVRTNGRHRLVVSVSLLQRSVRWRSIPHGCGSCPGCGSRTFAATWSTATRLHTPTADEPYRDQVHGGPDDRLK